MLGRDFMIRVYATLRPLEWKHLFEKGGERGRPLVDRMYRHRQSKYLFEEWRRDVDKSDHSNSLQEREY